MPYSKTKKKKKNQEKKIPACQDQDGPPAIEFYQHKAQHHSKEENTSQASYAMSSKQ